MSVEVAGTVVAVDPLFVNRLAHLRRHTRTPGRDAGHADVVLISHLHLDHFNLPSLRWFAPEVPVLVPRGAERLLDPARHRRVVPVSAGDRLEVNGVHVEPVAASHDDRRHVLSRARAEPLGYRVERGGRSFWFPGDTALRDDMADLTDVDLALAPVGGWGPGLGAGHLDAAAAMEAVTRVGARWAVPVHWGTFWPAGLLHAGRWTDQFTGPGPRFVEAARRMLGSPTAFVAEHGLRTVL